MKTVSAESKISLVPNLISKVRGNILVLRYWFQIPLTGSCTIYKLFKKKNSHIEKEQHTAEEQAADVYHLITADTGLSFCLR